jgi:hypothetical protein
MAALERSGPVPAALTANSLGECVPARAHGNVHSVFARVCNIEMGGELVTLLASELGAAPHGIRLDAQPARFDAWLRKGGRAILHDAVFWLPDAGVAVDLSAATLWRGAVSRQGDHAGATASRLRALRAMLCARAPRQGIALALVHAAGSMTSLERAFASRLLHVLPMLARVTRCRDIAAMAGAAEHLVGLGPGLTPAGDDFLTGWLAALWSSAARDSDLHAMLQPLVAALGRVFARTNAISRQMLEDAARGYFAQSLAEVTMAVSGAGEVRQATVRALSHGHSSGADALCGLLFGFAPELLMCGDEWRAPGAVRSNAGFPAAIAPIGSN